MTGVGTVSSSVHRATRERAGRVWFAIADASINLEIDGYPPPAGGLRIIGDYLFGEGDSVQGAFVFEQGGVLSGLEVCGYGTDAPVRLPRPRDLRPWAQGGGLSPK